MEIFESLPNYIEINQLNERNYIYAKRDGKDVRIATVFSQNREEVAWDGHWPSAAGSRRASASRAA